MGNGNQVWIPGMKLGPGAEHDEYFAERIKDEHRTVGAGTWRDPQIIWVQSARYPSDERAKAIETIVRDRLLEYRLTYAWIASDAHATSTIRNLTDNTTKKMDDDNHITLRMGKSENVCNVHGHFYLIHERNDPALKAVRWMRDDERSIVGGKNPQLYFWGPPQPPLSTITFPKDDWIIKPGSILDVKLKRKEAQTNTGGQKSRNFGRVASSLGTLYE
ncbi:hypothetical protein F5Y18DRAFT_427638 [Xylariaceae sp. FL1019]|nr:hypothetical protein F5Y18DRAFT_427638 [Xylariaceae sp. FL1019]